MRSILIIVAATFAMATTAAAADVYVLNKAGRCSIKGKGTYVTQSLCAKASLIKCKDGTTSPSKTTKGACSSHGGIAKG